MPVISRSEQSRSQTSDSVREYWSAQFREAMVEALDKYGIDLMLDRVREEIELAAESGLPPEGDRRRLVRAILRLIEEDEQKATER